MCKTTLSIKIGLLRLKLTNSRTADQESPHSMMTKVDNQFHNVILRPFSIRNHNRLQKAAGKSCVKQNSVSNSSDRPYNTWSYSD